MATRARRQDHGSERATPSLHRWIPLPLCPNPSFRASGDGGEVKGGRVVPPSLALATSHKDAAGRRTRPPSMNALSDVF